MTFKKATVVAALLGFSCAPSAAAPSPRLYLMTESSPPSSMLEGGRVTGSATEKVVEIMARTGTSYALDLMPWRRAYTVVQQRADACLFSTTRIPERENLFKWVGPTGQSEWVLFGRADRHYHLRTLEDARGLRIGTYNGDVRDEYLRGRGFRVDPAPDDMVNLRKLMLDRIDLWATGQRRSKLLRDAPNGWGQQVVQVLSFNRVGVYLACNLAVPTELIDRMNAAFVAMGRDGTVKRIDRKYEHRVEQLPPKP